jgi:hypothetical protein
LDRPLCSLNVLCSKNRRIPERKAPIPSIRKSSDGRVAKNLEALFRKDGFIRNES